MHITEELEADKKHRYFQERLPTAGSEDKDTCCNWYESLSLNLQYVCKSLPSPHAITSTLGRNSWEVGLADEPAQQNCELQI